MPFDINWSWSVWISNVRRRRRIAAHTKHAQTTRCHQNCCLDNGKIITILFIDIIDLLISTDSVTTGSDSGDKVRVDNHTCGNEPRRALAFDSQKISLRLHHCPKPSGYFNFDCGLNRPIFR